MVGSLVTIYVNKHTKNDKDKEKGLLIASGLIGGDAVMGVLIALLTILGIIPATKTAFLPSYVSLAAFARDDANASDIDYTGHGTDVGAIV